MRMVMLFVILIGSVYTAVPVEYYSNIEPFFPLNPSQTLHPVWWVFITMLYLIILILAGVIHYEVPRHKKVTKVFFYLHAYYIVEWLLHYYSFSLPILGWNLSTQFPAFLILLYVILRYDRNFLYDSYDHAFYHGRETFEKILAFAFRKIVIKKKP